MAGMRQFVGTDGTDGAVSAFGVLRAQGLRAARRQQAAPDRQARLNRTIEGEIIPRLMLAHRVARAADPQPGLQERTPDPEDVAEFARLVLAHDGDVAVSFVQVLRAEGMSLEALFVDLLAPTARLLGDLWRADLCDFTDVTVGVSRLQQIMRAFSPDFEDGGGWQAGRRALMVPVPGEQHTLGVAMVAEFYRRDGWEVSGEMPRTRAELVDLVRDEWFTAVGLSLSCEGLLGETASIIQLIRRKSLNRSVTIMVGGQLFLHDADLGRRVGADLTTGDGASAVARSNDLLGRMAMGA